MKRTLLTDFGIFMILVFICIIKPFAQAPTESGAKAPNPFSFLTIIKVDEVSTKEDMLKVKDALRTFGYKVHSHKINFERKEVLIRMRQEIPTVELVDAFKAAGYTAWFDPKAKVQPQDAVYRK